MHFVLFWLTCLLWIMMPVAMAWGVSVQDLNPHRGVYDLQLEHADNKTGILALSGRMVYQFSGSVCEGFTTQFRYVSRLEMEESAPRIHDQQTRIFEAGDGSELHVSNKNYTNHQLSDELEAVSRQQENGIVVEITKPQIQSHHLPSALFPNAQMVEMLQQAQTGVNFYQTTLYDNFETGDKLTAATVVIGAAQMQADKPLWPVTVSYFDDEKNPDGLPTYRSHFLLDSHGVSYDILLDYGDFSMRGILSQLDFLERNTCMD